MTENEKAELAYKDYFEKNKNDKLFFDHKGTFISGFFAGQRSMLEGSIGQTLHDLQKQIEKMKCCGNCRNVDEWGDCIFESPICCKVRYEGGTDEWKLKGEK